MLQLPPVSPTHDSFILLNSAVYTNFETGQYPDGWLLGDSGYACKPWLLIPKLNPQTRAERAYNKSHIKTRNVIERGFGVWKMRFRCLHKSAGHLSFSPRRCANVIIATARLHNKCVRRRIGLRIGLPIIGLQFYVYNFFKQLTGVQ